MTLPYLFLHLERYDIWYIPRKSYCNTVRSILHWYITSTADKFNLNILLYINNYIARQECNNLREVEQQTIKKIPGNFIKEPPSSD